MFASFQYGFRRHLRALSAAAVIPPAAAILQKSKQTIQCESASLENLEKLVKELASKQDEMQVQLQKMSPHKLARPSTPKVQLQRSVSVRSTQKVLVVVLTGGPCGGKSTGLIQVSSGLSELGLNVYCLPEASTMMFTAGCPFPVGASPDQMLAWEAGKMRIQEALEDQFTAVAMQSSGQTILLCDRGMSDSKAYVGEEQWDQLLNENGWTEENLLERYDAVIHLTTAAFGAEQFYTGGNNAARRESLEEARDIDAQIRHAWLNHRSVNIIKNTTTFQEKMTETLQTLIEEVGPKFGLEETKVKAGRLNVGELRYYLVTKGDIYVDIPELARVTPEYRTEVFLVGSTEIVEDRVAVTVQRGNITTHYLGTKINADDIRKERISKFAHRQLCLDVDNQLSPVHRIRHTFMDGICRVQVDEVRSPTQLCMISIPSDATPASFAMWSQSLGLKEIGASLYSLRSLARQKR